MKRAGIKGVGITVACAAFSACVPLEQAPLVYTSRQQVGVGVTAGTPENPGLDVNIGFKSLDAAFVPVAVAKYCPKSRVCGDINYNIATISGQNKVEGLSTVDQAAVDRYENQISQNSDIIRTTQPGIDAHADKLANITALPRKKADFDAIVPATIEGVEQPLADADKKKREALEKEIAAIELYKDDEPVLKSELKQLQDTIAEARRKREEAFGLLNQIFARKRMQTGDAKADAFSVYGTFNSSSGGNTSGASLTAGKVFSTGIAAQNLSQGVRDGSKTAATTSCIVAANTLLKEATLTEEQKKALPDRLFALCGLQTEP